MLKKGKIKWFDSRKRYGFIETDDCSVFVHGSSLGDELWVPKDGDKVIFELIHSPKGKKADNVWQIKSE